MNATPIALQLYSLREACAADLPGVLEKVAGWGYDGVEFAGLHGHQPVALRKRLNDLGLQCAGTHTKVDDLQGDAINQTIADHLVLGANFVIIPWIPEAMRADRESWLRTAELFTEVHQRLEASGLRGGFHCHFHDMKPLGDTGESGWDLVAKHTPAGFVMQFDTANAMQAQSDPVEPLRAYPERAATVHLKEYAAGHGRAVLGEGDVPWQDVLEACESTAGTRCYIIEFETPAGEVDLFDVAAKSAANLRELMRA